MIEQKLIKLEIMFEVQGARKMDEGGTNKNSQGVQGILSRI